MMYTTESYSTTITPPTVGDLRRQVEQLLDEIKNLVDGVDDDGYSYDDDDLTLFYGELHSPFDPGEDDLPLAGEILTRIYDETLELRDDLYGKACEIGDKIGDAVRDAIWRESLSRPGVHVGKERVIDNDGKREAPVYQDGKLVGTVVGRSFCWRHKGAPAGSEFYQLEEAAARLAAKNHENKETT